MSATSRQLFANNAISTLATSISLSDLTLTVSAGQGSLFPTPVSGEFFYLTLEDFSSREICKCTSRSGDLLTIVRAQEGTTALGFPAGASVQSRITKGTLEAFRDSAEAWVKVDAVTDIPAPSVSTASSVICGESDDSGSPILAVKDGSLWKFLSHPYPVVDSEVLSSVQTSITATGAFSALSVVGGKYILQITSGVLTGYSRVLTASSANVASWAEPLPFPVSSGETFSVYVSVTSRMKDLDDRSNFVTKGQFGLGGTSSVSVADFNTLSVTGQYYGTSATGAPVAGVLIIVDHVQGSGVGSAYQYASRVSSSVAWFRSQTGGVWNAWREAAMLDSPTFTGIPAAPTATVGTSTTQLATTAFVNAEITSDRPYEDSTANVKMNGVVAVGTASAVARGDHVHPTDTSRAATVSPAFTGTPTTPTAAVGTNTTQVASTEYTVAEIGSRAPTKLGVGASGTWGISVTGNAATATKLATARTINGVSFDGSANITIAVGETGRLPLTGGTLTGRLNGTSCGMVGTGNEYNSGAYEVIGNGPSNTVFPTIGFHQPGTYAASLQLRGATDFRFYAQGAAAYANVTANIFYGTLAGNATSATSATSATTLNGDQSNWASIRSSAVANMLGWKNFGNGHVIFDASQSTSPSGSAVDNTNSTAPWSAGYPTLMGWNGSTTYGVRVDSARVADRCADTGWVALSLYNGFTQDASNPLQIRRIGNIVFACGTIRRATPPAGLTEFTTIPSGYRPSKAVVGIVKMHADNFNWVIADVGVGMNGGFGLDLIGLPSQNNADWAINFCWVTDYA